MGFIYDISIKNGALVATDQKNIVRKQLHNVADVYTYEANDTLGTPKNLKIVEKYGNELELDVLNVGSISGVPFTGDFDALLLAVNGLIESLNSFSVTTTLDPNASTLSEQEKQTLSLNEISTKESEQIILQESINKQLAQRGVLTFADLTNSAVTPWAGFPLTIDEFQWTDGTFFPATTYSIASTVVNNVAELVALWNANVLDNKLQARDATSVYILEGAAPVPTDNNGTIQFSDTAAPFAIFAYVKVSSWAEEPDAVKSSINIIEEKTTLLADGAESLVSTEFQVSTLSVGNVAAPLVTSNSKRENVHVHCHTLGLWVRLKPAATNPSNREGYFLAAGEKRDFKTFANGQKYTLDISIINAVDGQEPTYSLSILNRP
jgi:hypothetical protein